MYSIYIYIRIRSLLIQGCNIDINLVCTLVSKLVPNAGWLMLTPKVSKKMLVRVRLASVQWLRWMFLRVLGVTRLHSRGKLYYCLAFTAVINRKQGIKWASVVWIETSGLRWAQAVAVSRLCVDPAAYTLLENRSRPFGRGQSSSRSSSGLVSGGPGLAMAAVHFDLIWSWHWQEGHTGDMSKKLQQRLSSFAANHGGQVEEMALRDMSGLRSSRLNSMICFFKKTGPSNSSNTWKSRQTGG